MLRICSEVKALGRPVPTRADPRRAVLAGTVFVQVVAQIHAEITVGSPGNASAGVAARPSPQIRAFTYRRQTVCRADLAATPIHEFRSMRNLFIPGLGVALTFFAAPACASCGSAFCTLMTDRFAQGTGDAHLGWSADLRLEFVAQTQLRSGTRNIDSSQVAGEEAIERRTTNQNLVTTLNYGVDADWSLTLRVPVVRRYHTHDLIDAATGLVATSEQWRFTKPGDVQLLARRQFVPEDGNTTFALFGGLKLPTGATRITNPDGARAERALQPGTGTTDAVIGLAARHVLGGADAVVGQVGVTAALNQQEDFRPGAKFEGSVGWSHAFSPDWGTVLQVNIQRRASDCGTQAEPLNSGSTTVSLSPGVTISVGRSSTIYAYAQIPVYQKVTGIQLVPRSLFAVGWTGDF